MQLSGNKELGDGRRWLDVTLLGRASLGLGAVTFHFYMADTNILECINTFCGRPRSCQDLPAAWAACPLMRHKFLPFFRHEIESCQTFSAAPLDIYATHKTIM